MIAGSHSFCDAGSISIYDAGYNSDFGKSRHRAWWESMYFGRYGKLKAKSCFSSSAGSLKV